MDNDYKRKLEFQEELVRHIRNIAISIVREVGITSTHAYGEVAGVESKSKLSVYVNGSEVVQKIPCNPDVSFSVGDHVIVSYINGNRRDPFVVCRRVLRD